ncbi:hypothetical protein BDV98DRAFT_586528 [Pterulicium gracile]|uniref:Uncharacterized protein n=1 Tax=Pterulicium gracile TaxID=1884261 RepID=A0A5C3Q245_9AGAR|nr:hypothetical protein BDV98DRAFT_586528 [Pterula gracilis]
MYPPLSLTACISKANGFGESGKAALAWMSRLPEPFFLYIDKADDPTTDLITGLDSAIHLDSLTREEAVALLHRSARMQFEDVNKEIATTSVQNELHLHALAIVQAGTAIFKMQCTLDEYAERFRQVQKSLPKGEIGRIGPRVLDNYPADVYTT